MGLIGGIAGIFTGAGQRKEGKKMFKKGDKMMKAAWKKREANPYQIPDAIGQNVAQAANELGSKPMVQQAMEDAAAKRMSAGLTAVNRYATSSADAIAASAGMLDSYNEGMNQSAIAGANVRQQNLSDLYSAKNTLADYESMKWDMNVNQPFLQRLEIASGLMNGGMSMRNAGTQTMTAGIGAVGDVAESFIGSGGLSGLFKKSVTPPALNPPSRG
jgi:hypothetical protein